jgi:undecaprenyl-diphosphatase
MIIPIFFAVLLLGLVQGLSEFLPVSSSGHLILADRLVHFEHAIGGPRQVIVFEVFIQLGAIAALLVEYGRELWRTARAIMRPSSPGRPLALALAIGTLPVVAVGGLLGGNIHEHLYSPVVVAWAFILGGVVIWIVEYRPQTAACTDLNTITPGRALLIGLVQVLALIPGTSRSGATIIGGMCAGLDRRTATEFSFLLALPVLVAATVYTLAIHRELLDARMSGLLAAGFLVSFLSAWAVLRWLLRFVRTHTFKSFAIYRVAFGVLLLAMLPRLGGG